MNRSPRDCQQRSGFVLLVTMLALLVVVSLLATLLDGTRQRHRHVQLQRQVRQAELLVAAGRDLALQRLAGDPEYRGEVWEPLVSDSHTARVELRLTDDARSKAGRLLVTVTLLSGGDAAVRRSGTFTPPRPGTPTNQED